MKQNRYKFIWLFIVCIALNINILAASDEGINILRKSDSILFPDQARFTFRMEDYENQKARRYYVYQGYSKGNDRYLLIGLEPALVKGIAQLRISDSIYNYLKKIDQLQQLSAKVAFGNSTLSQEDVMGGKLENYYNVDNCTTSQENGHNVYVLTLVAKSKEVAYHKIVSYLDTQTYYPIKRQYYSFSGQQVREMIFEDIQLKDDKLALLKSTMYDSLKKGFYSKVTLSDFDYTKAVLDTYFTKMYLKFVTK